MTLLDALLWWWTCTSVIGLLVRLLILRQEILDWRAAQPGDGGKLLVAQNALVPSTLSALMLLALVIASLLTLFKVEGRQVLNVFLLSLVPFGLMLKALIERWGRRRVAQYLETHER